jgi:hypothetical protein
MMDNKISKRIKRLIAAVLVLFFAIVLFEFLPAAHDGFVDGWNAGQADANAARHGGIRHFVVDIKPTDSHASALKFADGIEFRTFEASGDLMLPELVAPRPAWSNVLSGVLALLGVAAGLTFIVRLVMFAARFPRRRVMSRENVVAMRWIAGSLGTIGVAEFLDTLGVYLWLRGNVALDGYRFVFDPSTTLIVALIIWAMTEIMNLAGKLQNEQELTI